MAIDDDNGRRGVHKRVSDDPVIDSITKIATLISVGGGAIALMAGWINIGSSNQQSIQQMKDQMAEYRSQSKEQSDELSKKIDELNKMIAQGPRADQLQGVARDVGAQSGRIDSLDERERNMENQVSAILARISAIDDASNVSLGKERPGNGRVR